MPETFTTLRNDPRACFSPIPLPKSAPRSDGYLEAEKPYFAFIHLPIHPNLRFTNPLHDFGARRGAVDLPASGSVEWAMMDFFDGIGAKCKDVFFANIGASTKSTARAPGLVTNAPS